MKDSVRNRKEIQDSIRDWSKDEKVAGRITEETIALHPPSLTQNMDLYIQEIQKTLGRLKRYRIPNILPQRAIRKQHRCSSTRLLSPQAFTC